MSLRTCRTQTNAIKYDLQAFSGRLSLGCCWGWYPWSLKIIFQSYLTNHRRSTRTVNPKSHWNQADGLSFNHRRNHSDGKAYLAGCGGGRDPRPVPGRQWLVKVWPALDWVSKWFLCEKIFTLWNRDSKENLMIWMFTQCTLGTLVQSTRLL